MKQSRIRVMPGGMEEYFNPFAGNTVWYVPGRKNRPFHSLVQTPPAPLAVETPENYCDFCAARYFKTPPEKSRLVLSGRDYVVQSDLSPVEIFSAAAEFRRVANLFEILSLEYWQKNHGFRLSQNAVQRKQRYLSVDLGRNHALAVVNLKLHYSGYSQEQIESMPADEKLSMTDSFFAGSHDLIIPRRHFVQGAEIGTELASSGELTAEEHYQYIRFTIQGVREIFANNRHVRYVSVYQNWLRDAGASFDHLHKQLVALDEWGDRLEHVSRMVLKNSHAYNDDAANFACANDLVIAENDHAIAFVECGHPFPTAAIFSKGVHCRPWEHTPDEVRGLSDLVHGIHAALSGQRACNEEWTYMPRDSRIPIPWHLSIKWRANISAGFEGGTRLYIVPFSVSEFRDMLVPRLFELRADGKIASFHIARECRSRLNPLQYHKCRTKESEL